MAQLDTGEIKKRSDAAWAIRDMWRSILIEAYEMAFAGMNPYHGNKKGPRPLNNQFDSTAVASVIRLANRILMELTPPYQNWVSLEPGPILDIKLGDNKGAREQASALLSSTARIANIAVNNGAAVDARASAFLDVVVAGMGCVLGLEDTTDDVEPIIDVAVSQSEIAIEENAKGRISGIYRKRVIKVREIKALWEDAVVPESITNDTGKGKDPEIEVLEVTYEGGPKSKVAWHYEVLYCHKNTDPIRMVERVYETCPWTIWRWMKLPGLPYGPGPVIMALADIRTLNKVMEFMLKNAALALAGMYLVRDDGVVNLDNMTITPGGLITVQSTGGNLGASVVPLTTNREFDLGQILLQDLRQAIKKHLFDTSLPPDRATPSSATEIIQRVKELSQDIGVGIGRVQADTEQYVRRRIEMLVKRGLVPPMKVDQYTTKIKINSPLARAAHLQEVETVIQALQTVRAIGGDQALMVAADLERVCVWILEKMGFPPELLNSAAERDEMQKNMGTMAAAGAMDGGQAAAALPMQAV